MNGNINNSIKEKILKANTYTSDYTGIIVTEAILDSAEAKTFRLLYNPRGSSYIYIYLNERDKLSYLQKKELAISSPEKPVTPADLSKLKKDNSIIQMLEFIIETILTSNGAYSGAGAEAKTIRENLIASVYELSNDNTERLAVINNVTEAEIKADLEKILEATTQEIVNEDINALKENIKSCRNIKKTQQQLGNFLNTEYGIILRANSHEVYILDPSGKAYESIEEDSIIGMLAEIFKEKNIVHSKDLHEAIEFITDRLHPQSDIIKFKNGVYDLKEHQLIEEVEAPIFTLMECPVNYNPEAESTYLKQFLETSLKQPTPELTARYILGVKQLIGYLFTSGNDRTLLPIITGVSGAGKSIFCSVLERIVNDKISNVPLQDMDKDHLTSALVGTQLNIIYDSGTKPIVDNGKIKQVTSDSIGINPKGLKPYTLPAKEVPKTILVCNQTPIFTNPESAILERLMFIEFKHKFRGTGAEDKDLKSKILDNPEELEWLVYESLEAYRELIENDNEFILKLNTEDTRHLLDKHSKPLNYLVSELIAKYDKEAYEEDLELCKSEAEKDKLKVIALDLNNLIVYLAKKEGLELNLDKRGLVNGKVLTGVLKRELEIENSEEFTTKVEKFKGVPLRTYPNLIKSELYEATLLEMKELGEPYKK